MLSHKYWVMLLRKVLTSASCKKPASFPIQKQSQFRRKKTGSGFANRQKVEFKLRMIHWTFSFRVCDSFTSKTNESDLGSNKSTHGSQAGRAQNTVSTGGEGICEEDKLYPAETEGNAAGMMGKEGIPPTRPTVFGRHRTCYNSNIF